MSKLSYANGLQTPLVEMTLAEALARMRSVIPTARALVSLHQSLRYTWREFDDAVTRVALGLAGLALRRQDRVGNWSANSAEWILLQYACARAMLEAIQKEKPRW